MSNMGHSRVIQRRCSRVDGRDQLGVAETDGSGSSWPFQKKMMNLEKIRQGI